MASRTRVQLENWLKQIEVKGSVLDIGGSQNPIKGRTKSWQAEEYKILDLESPHESKITPDIKWDMNDCLGVENYDWLIYEKRVKPFDIAFCIEVSEYWFNSFQAIENIYKLLKTGGLLYISFHFIYPIHSPVGQDYLRFTPDGAERLLTENGFKILEHKFRRTEVISFEPLFAVEGMRFLQGNNNIIGSLIKAQK